MGLYFLSLPDGILQWIMHKIGLRYEDKYLMEKRVALVPNHVRQLVRQGIQVEVEKSDKRVFRDSEYAAAGARLVDELKEADLVLGVKEMPLGYFSMGKTYVFFSHTIKGQPYNMPLLRDMMAHKVNLVDYERIVDESGQRLIFFGKFAGLAGMINSLWSLGQRYRELGIDTPFLHINQTHQYDSLELAKKAVKEVGDWIRRNGVSETIAPLTVGITGYGNVSNGAQEILDLLPVEEISPGQLLELEKSNKYSLNVVYKTVFKEEDLSRPRKRGAVFELQHYYQHPDQYENQFEHYIPQLTVLMNCMYWDDRYPRIVTKDYLEKLFTHGTPKLTVIGDVTCDPDGSIECTHKGTEIEDPVFVFNPFPDQPKMGFRGKGILVMAVDILPSELPREASQTFSDALIGFIPSLVRADFQKPFDKLDLPFPIRKAMILHNGELTDDYKYLEEFVS